MSDHADVHQLVHVAVGHALGRPDLNDRDAELKRHLARVCEIARRRGLRAEEVLIILKASWREQHGGRLTYGRNPDGVLSHVITTCIEEFYRDA